MIEIQDMGHEEIEEMLRAVGYGHLAFARDNTPHVVPINYTFDSPDLLVYTTEGMKTAIIDENPKVCLQVEQMTDDENWRSVVVNGEARRITDRAEVAAALKLIMSTNPDLSPALSIRWVDNWIRENREVIYRIVPQSVTGRSSLQVRVRAAFARPAARPL